jgi:hypothetical protein
MSSLSVDATLRTEFYCFKVNYFKTFRCNGKDRVVLLVFLGGFLLLWQLLEMPWLST